MGKFRVELDVAFSSESDAVSFLNLLQEIKSKLFAGTGEEQIAIVSKCRYHECFHDNTPAMPCSGYINYDLTAEVKEEVKTVAGVKVAPEYLIKEIVDAKIVSAVDVAIAEERAKEPESGVESGVDVVKA